MYMKNNGNHVKIGKILFIFFFAQVCIVFAHSVIVKPQFTAMTKYCELWPPQWGVDILFLLFPASGPLVSAHLKEKYLSYLYQIWYGCLLG